MSEERHECERCGCTLTWNNPNYVCPECGFILETE